MLYSLHYNQKLLGLFDSLEECFIMAQSLVFNNFVNIDDIIIKEFKKNSILFKRDLVLNEHMNINHTEHTDDSDDDSDDESNTETTYSKKSNVSYESDSIFSDSQEFDMNEIKNNDEYIKIEEEKKIFKIK